MNRRKAAMAVIFLSAMLSGCGGQVMMESISPEALNLPKACLPGAAESSSCQLPVIAGALTHLPVQVVQIGELTQTTASDGKTPTGVCRHVPTKKLVTMPGPAVRVYYQRGSWFDSNSFNMTQNADGIFTGFNSTSNGDPAKTLATLATAAATLAPLVPFVANEKAPPCTTAENFVKFEALPRFGSP